MPPDAEIVYFDTSVFIAWFNNEPGRADAVEQILVACSQGSLRVITSIVSLTEVAYSRTAEPRSDQEQIDAQINALLLDERLIGMVAFDQRVALRARRLVRAGAGNREGLSVLDAIHLASAEVGGATYFATYDGDFARASAEVGMRIGQPTLEFIR